MKNHIWYIIISALFLFTYGDIAFAGKKDKPVVKSQVVVEFFFQPGCGECEKVKQEVLPEFQELFSEQAVLRFRDVSKTENFAALVKYIDKFKVSGNEPVSVVIGGRFYLNGYRAIRNGLIRKTGELLVSSKRQSERLLPQTAVNRKNDRNREVARVAERFTLLMIISTGLIDGINPCVFSTLIFFLSLLSISKFSRRQLLVIGTTYCTACFLCYLAMGFGLSALIHSFYGYKSIRTVLNLGLVLVLGMLAVMSFYDALIFRRTGKAEKIKLQLPDRLKNLIHRVMKKGLNMKMLVPGAFFIGFTVTVFEAACTGQVYVPTLVMMVKVAPGIMKWSLLLLLYNLMFIIPLVLIFIIFLRGARIPKLIKWSRNNVFASKILMGLFFVILAILMFI